MKGFDFSGERLSDDQIARLEEMTRRMRGDILQMTFAATCGHPGGSMSSADVYAVLYACAKLDPKNPYAPDRDRVVPSHGHTSPGVYSALAAIGYFDRREVVAHFRQAGSLFEGHVERIVPGCEWTTGNLGQGMSAAAGFAATAKVTGQDFRVWCVMGDGEQQKGQIAEARRFATKFGLTNLTAFVDLNCLQISGETNRVMPQEIESGWASDGWLVEEIDGHDYQEIYRACRLGLTANKPLVVVCRSVMGKGYSKIENDHGYHGKAVTREMLGEALAELGLPDDTDEVLAKRAAFKPAKLPEPPFVKLDGVKTGTPRDYPVGEKADNRGAWGAALMDIADANMEGGSGAPVAVFDCDLASSVRTTTFAKKYPDNFFQCGIQEHHAAACAGAMSTQGVLTFWSDFGVFGTDEAYNQNRLNDINGAQIKIVCTHCGLDVGEDGKTHQCVDYIGVFSNFYGFKIIMPADPNQTDRAVRYISAAEGPFFVGMGRRKIPPVAGPDGEPYFVGDYEFVYGKAEEVRSGDAATVIATGQSVIDACAAADGLAEEGVKISVLGLACVSDPDRDAIVKAAKAGPVVTVEDHNVHTGFGSIVAGVIAESGVAAKFARLGPTDYGGSGTPDDLYADAGIDAASISAKVKEMLG